MYVEVISDDREIKDFCYEPLKSGASYKAAFEGHYFREYYTRVFFYIDDETRDFKLNNLGI